MNNLARNIAILRINADFKQLDIELKTGIKRNTLSNWENGVSEPSIADLITLAQFFGVTVDEMIQSDFNNSPPGVKKVHRRFVQQTESKTIQQLEKTISSMEKTISMQDMLLEKYRHELAECEKRLKEKEG